MSNRSWFVADGDRQDGPYSEDQLRALVAKGNIGPNTYVWSEGMSAWQLAGDVPGLLSLARPPAFPNSVAPLADGVHPAGSLSIDFSIWELLGRALLYLVSFFLIVPLPWAVTSIYRWFVAQLHVPHRTNPKFVGQPGDIWYVFVIQALCFYAGASTVPYLQYALLPVQAFVGWMIVRWFIANVSPDGHQRLLTFTGSAWGYVGWYVLGFLSLITVIGWAWVMTAWMRWICRHIEGTRRQIVFNARGGQMLWRTLAFVLGLLLIIPIPWVLGWYVRWAVSQIALVKKTA